MTAPSLAISGNSTLHNVTVSSNAIVTGNVYTTAWTDYSATSSYVGWVSFTTQKLFYKKVGRLVFVAFQLEGTANSSLASFTLPVARPADGFQHTFPLAGDIMSGGASVTTDAFGTIASGGSSVTLSVDRAGTAWSTSSAKRASGSFWYEAAS